MKLKSIKVYFCKTNLDLFTDVLEKKLKERGFSTIEKQCLGLCGECMTKPTYLIDGSSYSNRICISDLLNKSQVSEEKIV